MHETNGPPSSEHSSWATPTPPESLPVKVSFIEVDELLSLLSKVLLFPSVAEFIVLNGAIVSTDQLNDVGDDVFPTLSLENIFKVCIPSLKELNSNGLVQVMKFELSILQSKLLMPTPSFSTPPLSMAENENVAEFEDVLPLLDIAELLPLETETIEVVGGTVSTFQLNDARDTSLFPTLS